MGRLVETPGDINRYVLNFINQPAITPANALVTPAHIKPEWYFLPTYQLLKYFTGNLGKFLGIVTSGVPFLLLFIWPFIERGVGRRPRRRKWAVAVGCFAVLAAIILLHLRQEHDEKAPAVVRMKQPNQGG